MRDDVRLVLSRPRWLVFAVILAVLIPTSVRLGLWQLDRLEERTQQNVVWGARLDADPVPIEVILDAGATLPSEQRRYLRVTMDGTYLPTEQVIVRNRSLDGRSGSWVVTPMRLGDGVVVAVLRGWIPLGITDPLDEVLDPPAGGVSLEGVLVPSERPVALGPTDPGDGRLTRLALLDLDRLGRQVDEDLGSEYVQQTSEELGVSLPPELLDLPDLTDEGNHLAYAIQWFSFALIGLAGFRALARREAARLRRAATASPLEVVDGADVEE